MGNQESSVGSRVVLQSDSEDCWRIERLEEEDALVCLFTSLKDGERCSEGMKVLRVLRHPNVLKFLSLTKNDPLSFRAELVYPLQVSLPSERLEGVVRGWRDIGCGLDFIHTKVGLSHNNIHIGCVFVGGHDSKWKIGGFELAAEQSKCTKQYLAAVSSFRHRDAIPPEDEDDSSTTSVTIPIHSRDVWAFGNLMLQTIEDINDEEDIPDEMIYYINNEMLNQSSPELRPSLPVIMEQSWMNNTTTTIIDFLANLTLKSQPDKDEFFKTLALKLHALPSTTVAEHIVPLLLTPLVMAEPIASHCLWEHLLCPVSATHPSNKVFQVLQVNPLLEEDQFRSHVLPSLLNLLESRDYHVRLILLHYLHLFCHLCSKEDLIGVILPEVLVGLKDCHDDIVAATLHALGELVPILGSAVVMGTNRKSVFSDTRPKIKAISSHVYTPTKSSTAPASFPIDLSKNNTSQMQQCNASASESGESSLIPTMAISTSTKQQYSPSASITDDTSDHYRVQQQEQGHQREEEEWEEFEAKSDANDGWGSWGDKLTTDEEVNDEIPVVNEEQLSSRLFLGTKEPSVKNETDQTGTASLQSTNKSESDLRRKLKGQLSEEDVKRLEEKAQWFTGVDLFADMAPKISKTVRHNSTVSTTKQTTSASTGSTKKMNYDYNPPESEVKDAWSSEEWNNDDL